MGHGDGPSLIAMVEALAKSKEIQAAYPCQEELAHLGRLAITGEMVADLVHELSQPLGSIIPWVEGCASLVRSDGAARAELLAGLEGAAREVHRATEMVCRLKDFLRKGPPRRSEVEITTLVGSVVAMAEPEARRKEIAIRVLPDRQQTTVVTDGIQIEQVILNLLMNAMEAIDGSGAVRRKVVVQTTDAGDDAVEVAVSDTGPWLSTGVREGIVRAVLHHQAR